MIEKIYRLTSLLKTEKKISQATSITVFFDIAINQNGLKMSCVPVVSILQVYLYLYCARGASLQVLRYTYICPLHIYAALKSVDLTPNDVFTETLTFVTRCQRSEQTAAER